MRGVLLEVPDDQLEERRRGDRDIRDEMWDGELHTVPPPSGPHQRLSGGLFLTLGLLARELGLLPHFETGLFRAERDYRVTDLMFCRPEQVSQRGAEGAELVVELRSPDDESYAKLPFYSALGVREALVVHPDDRRVELFRLVGDAMLPVTADADGAVRSDVVGVRMLTRDGALHLTWDGGAAVV